VKRLKQSSQLGGKRLWARPDRLLCFLFVFICFFPNPALPIGANTGVQTGQVIALLFLPVVLMRGLPKRQTLALLLLLLPLLASGFLAVLTGRAVSNEVVAKSTIMMFLAFVVLVPVGWIIRERYLVPLLSGVAVAVVAHAVVGGYQAFWFARDVFPLAGLYQNPSFGSLILGPRAEEWALYVKRPFGLFPEPSAMSASIGPWLVLVLGILLSPSLRHRMTRGTGALLLVAAVSGVALMIVSRSGYTIPFMASALLVSLPALRKHALRLHRPSSLIVLSLLVLMFVTVMFLAVTYLGSRLDIQQNSSWSARAASIVYGLTYLGASPANLFFGIGPGQSYLILQSSSAVGPYWGSAELAFTAVWSVVVTYIQETGLLGALALGLVLFLCLRAINRSSARLMGLSCLIAWLAGVVLTTSYPSLLPIWLFLGVLLSWDRIFKFRAVSTDAAHESISRPLSMRTMKT
jgi:hypothetical protein